MTKGLVPLKRSALSGNFPIENAGHFSEGIELLSN